MWGKQEGSLMAGVYFPFSLRLSVYLLSMPAQVPPSGEALLIKSISDSGSY